MVIAASSATIQGAMLSHTGLLGRGEIGPFLGLLEISMNFKILALVVLGLEGLMVAPCPTLALLRH